MWNDTLIQFTGLGASTITHVFICDLSSNLLWYAPVTSVKAVQAGSTFDFQVGDIGVIVASSSSVYGSNPALPKHEDLATRPLSPYGASKLAAEAYTLAYGATYGMPNLAFRFFNVFGPLQAAGHAYAAVIPAFVDAALAGRPIPVHGDGTQSRDFTYVDTVASVIRDAVVNTVSSPEPVNLAYGTRTNLLEVITLMEQELGRPLEREFSETRAGDVPHSQADGSVLRHLFPEVAPVEFEDGLRRTVAWFEGAALP